MPTWETKPKACRESTCRLYSWSSSPWIVPPRARDWGVLVDRRLAAGEPHLRANRSSGRGSRCDPRHSKEVLPQVWICPTQRRPAAPVPADADRSQVEVAAILDTLPCVQAILGAAGQQLGKSSRILCHVAPSIESPLAIRLREIRRSAGSGQVASQGRTHS